VQGDRRTVAEIRALVAALLLAAFPVSAGGTVPGQVNFQGLLIDGGGAPVTGVVDLVVTLYDAETGGSALWSELHDDVPVQDGVYDLALGSTTPLTAVDLSGGTVYLEVEVDGETLQPRQRLLAVPYALHAETSDELNGLAGGYFTELIEHSNFDGGGPSNLDPKEGLTDIDSDGVANFIDPDNDGASDEDEGWPVRT